MPRRDDIYLKSLYFAIWAAVGAFGRAFMFITTVRSVLPARKSARV